MPVNYRHLIYPSLLLFLLTPPAMSWAQGGCGHTHHREQTHTSSYEFIKNKGQEHPNVAFTVPIGGMNRLFIEPDAFTYLLHDEEAYRAIHELWHTGTDEEIASHKVPGHAYKARFKGATPSRVIGEWPEPHYHNYYRGNDPGKWASKVPIFKGAIHKDLYPNIDLASYSNDLGFKYDLVLHPGADPGDIVVEYEGITAENIYTKSGNLFIRTSVGISRESAPYAYQYLGGKKKKVPCEYQLDGTTLRYHFPEGYDEGRELVIDPQIIAATMSGTTGSENFGHTSTFDNEGNIYAGATSFGVGYPTSMGAFDNSFNGGTPDANGGATDIAVSKFNPTGTVLLYATYIGGNDNERPHSMVVDFNNQLSILGSTLSQDYPTTANAYQPAKNGSSDITVTKLNMDGTALVGSTFIGGDQSDGINISQINVSYAEEFRGEIILDGQGNIYVASFSSSTNFPTTPGVFQPDKSGGQDGVVFKLNNDLSTLFWSTFIGGDNHDTAAGIKIDDEGNVWVTGTAADQSFPMPSGGVQDAWPGGQENAYIVSLSPNARELAKGTYWGSPDSNEHGYFLDIDENDNIHILGTTTGANLPISQGVYSNPGAPQFLTAFNNSLDEVTYSTTIGSSPYGTNSSFFTDYNFAPIAFMVDKCNKIYLSGYGAQSDLPLTPNAFDTSPGSFYLAVLEPNATALSFGTYYGDADHVDGGTSRFDKSGIVYQAVCACDPNAMATLPSAYATSKQERCDIGVFKIDFEEATVTAALTAQPSASGCVPFNVDLRYTGQSGETFEWWIDGDFVANTENTSYSFTEAGSYDVMLVAETGQACNVRDTAFLRIDVLDGTSTVDSIILCPQVNNVEFLDVSTVNATYNWHDGFTGSTYSITGGGVYWVDISLDNCTQRDSFVIVESTDLYLDLGDDFVVCDLPSTLLDVEHSEAVSYSWSNGATEPTLLVTETDNYAVTLTDINNCELSDDINVTFQTTPVFTLQDSLICEGDTVTLSTDINDANYTWSDNSTAPLLAITEEGEYWLTLDNGCLYSDTMYLSLSYDPVELEVADIPCVNDCNGNIMVSIAEWADLDSLALSWNIGGGMLELENLCENLYELTVVNELGCLFTHSVDLVQPDSIIYDTEWTDVTCHGDMNGSINILNLQGGTPPYELIIDRDTINDSFNLAGLPGGTYHIIIRDMNDCIFPDTVDIFEPRANYVYAGPDKYITLGDSVRLDGFVERTEGHDVGWLPMPGMWCLRCIQPIVTPVDSTTYTLSVTDLSTGCIIQDSAQVFVDKPRAVYIPNSFTPNSDGANDFFSIFTNQGVEQINTLKIFDRWGELVYQQDNFPPNIESLGWDGRLDGKEMNPAVFVYWAEVLFKDGYLKFYKGDITLVR